MPKGVHNGRGRGGKPGNTQGKKTWFKPMSAPLGNKNATNHKLWKAAIKGALERRTAARTDGLAELDALAEKLLDLVAAGDISALREFGDRMDGKPSQAIVGGEDDEPPVKVTGIIELVRPAV